MPITVKFDQPTPSQAKFWIRLVGAGAVAGQDFRAMSETLYPPTGSTEMIVVLTLLSDTTPECDEGLFIEYTGAYAIDDATRIARVLIRNDDGPVAGCDNPFVPSTPVNIGIDGGTSPSIPDATPEVSTGPEAGAEVKVAPDVGQGPLSGADAGVATDPLADAGAPSSIPSPDSGPAPQTPSLHSSCACFIGAATDVGAASYALPLLGFAVVCFARRRRGR